MKRMIKSSNEAANLENDRKYGIGLFVDNKLLGYVFKWNEVGPTVRVKDDLSVAKQYSNLSSAKRALAQYNYYNKIYLYDNTSEFPVVQYVKDTVLQNYKRHNVSGNYEDISKCRLEVIEL